MRISWLVEKRVILIEISHSVVMADVIELNRSVKAHLSEGGDNTHVICLMDALEVYPSNISELRKNLDYPQHPHIGWNITVTQNRVLRFLGALLYKIMGRSTLKFASSYSEAVVMLRELDPTLPELPEMPQLLNE